MLTAKTNIEKCANTFSKILGVGFIFLMSYVVYYGFDKGLF